MILSVVLSCCLWAVPSAVDAAAAPVQTTASAVENAVPISSPVRLLASTAVKLWGALAAASLGLSAVMFGSMVAMLATAGGLHLGYNGPTVGTDVLLGLAALSALGAGITLAVGLGASLVGGLWWVADLLTDW